MENISINEILHVINNELVMYDDLAKNEKYKKDREVAKKKENNMEIELEVVLHTIYKEIVMYDDLAKNDKYKKDREVAKNKWLALESLYKEIKKLGE